MRMLASRSRLPGRPVNAWLVVVGLLLAASAALAGPGPDTGAGRDRPRVGLVLGGGGAKGAAHVGVLRVLDELRVPVDCVAGTSMGALVGATFASGLPPAELEAAVRAINWSQTVGSEGLREREPIQRKLAGITYSNGLEIGFSEGRLRVPGGLLKTQDIEEVLRLLVADARSVRDFDALALPFRAVATDMQAGEMVVLGSGDLTEAMRASMAVPGAFSPVVLGDRVLADGGMMRNLPVDVARELCADVVIAVSLASPPPPHDVLLSAVGLVGRSIDVMIDANERAQLATLTERDVAIVVPMGNIGAGDFQRVPEAIPLGAEAARARTESLQRYALSEAAYRDWRQGIDRSAPPPARLASVRVAATERVNPEYVQARIRSAADQPLSLERLAEDTSRIYALGDFERVGYRLTGDPTSPELEIEALEKSWGPNFLRFDLGLAGTAGGDVLFVLRGEHRRPWINRRGGEWRNLLQVGSKAELETGWYQPIDVRQRFFLDGRLRVDRALEDVFDDGDRVARYDLLEGFAQIDAGVNLSTRAQLRAGLRWGAAEADVDVGSTELPEVGRTRDTAAVVTGVYDTRDTAYLPTRGVYARARYLHSAEWLGGEQDYELFEGMIAKAVPWRGDVLYLVAAGGSELDGDLPPYRDFQLGGISSFPGLQRGELRGDEYWLGSVTYLWKLAELQALFGQAIYAGLGLQGGRMSGRVDGVSDGALYGASLTLGGRTPLGPLNIALGATDEGSWELHFALGRPIEEGTILDQVW